MKKIIFTLSIGLSMLTMQASAAVKEFTIIIKDHKFIPQSLEVPAEEKIRLLIDNQDATAEEFESHTLHREKIIKGNSKAVILVGPLKAGEYEYFGEFNPDSAQGKIIAR